MKQRNYSIYPAQTNLELYEQLLANNYSDDFVVKVHKAYMLSLGMVYNLFRGSGKPFICHLVGTASLLAAINEKESIIIGGLLHALYQNRVTFKGKDLKGRRDFIVFEFGIEIEEIIYKYSIYEEIQLNNIRQEEIAINHDEVLIHLADHIEDLIGYSIFLHGNEVSNLEAKGSYLSRKKRYELLKPSMDFLTTHFNLPTWKDSINYWTDFEKYQRLPKQLKTGFNNSFTLNDII